MSSSSTLYWYDLETFGLDPKRDRIAQFAGLRTDIDLNVIGEPLVTYCQPADDMLPAPESCYITGITPQHAKKNGFIEAKFIAQINKEFLTPNTCVVGYNSIRFDDEFVRYTLYRNLYDPYEREWKNGNSRWDLIDMVRLTRALRPDGIEWPSHADGLPSFKLEELTAANGISHENAHDALSDVHATIAMAKLIKEKQSRLFDYVFSLKNKHEVFSQLNLNTQKPVLHISGMFPSQYYCATAVAPVAQHPTNKNGVIVFDLREDPSVLLDLSVEEIRERVFTARDDLPDGVSRIPLKTIHANKCPIVAPIKTVDANAMDRIQLDMNIVEKHLAVILANSELKKKVSAVFSHKNFIKTDDPDQQLYQGFFNAQDKATMEHVRSLDPQSINSDEIFFNDGRLDEMLFRYRARNYPDTLSPIEHKRWQQYCMTRFNNIDGGGSLTLDEFNEIISKYEKSPETTTVQHQILKDLRSYSTEIVMKAQA